LVANSTADELSAQASAAAAQIEEMAQSHFFSEVKMQKSSWISEPYVTPESDDLVIAFAAPLLFENEVHFVVTGTLAVNKNVLFQRIADYKIFDSGYLSIASPQLNVIYHPLYPNQLRRLPANQIQLVRETLSATNESVLVKEYERGEWLQTFYRLPNIFWIVSLSVPAEESLAGIDSYIDAQFRTGLIATLIAILLMTFIVRVRLRVFKRLAKQVQAVRSGRAVQLDKTGLEEIDLLIKRFNHLIHENELSHREATQRQAYLDLVLSTSSVGHFMANSKGFIEYVNDTLVIITGYTREQLLQGAIADNIIDSDEKAIKSRWLDALEQQRESQIEFKFKHGHDQEVWLKVHSKPVFDHGICLGHVGTVSDVTEENSRIEDLRSKAYRDELTRLMNRRGIEQVMHNAWHEAHLFNRDLVFLALDLDNFKAVNDELGHEAGDMLLEQVARALESAVRDTDWVGRLGGDEFIIVLPGCPKERAARIAAAVVESVALIKVHENQPPVTVSIGLAIIRRDDQSELDMLRRADKAAYQAKYLGRNRWVFAADMGI